jgi:hypothetical protein
MIRDPHAPVALLAARSGLGTKLHTRTNAEGFAIGFCLTVGQVADYCQNYQLCSVSLPRRFRLSSVST